MVILSGFVNLSTLGVEGNNLDSLSTPPNLKSASIDDNPYSTSIPNFSNLVSSKFSYNEIRCDFIKSKDKHNKKCTYEYIFDD